MKVDLLAIVAHPDDAEISCGGTLLRHIDQGYSTGIVDLTRGELGSRGSADLRDREAAAAAEKLGLTVRENLCLADGFFGDDKDTMLKVVEAIRKYQPELVVTNAPSDRHPDHGRAGKLVSDACFYAGLRKIETDSAPWRPRAVYHAIQDYYLSPGIVVDVTPYWEKKIEVLRCYASQFYDPGSDEPATPISGKEFFDFLKSRAMDIGRPSGMLYAEGFIPGRPPGVDSLFSML